MRPAAAEEGDTDGEEGHGDDNPRPGGVQLQSPSHAYTTQYAVIILEAEIVIRQYWYFMQMNKKYRALFGCFVENV